MGRQKIHNFTKYPFRLTPYVHFQRIAFSIALLVAPHTSVAARPRPRDALQNQALVTNNNARSWQVFQQLSL